MKTGPLLEVVLADGGEEKDTTADRSRTFSKPKSNLGSVSWLLELGLGLVIALAALLAAGELPAQNAGGPSGVGAVNSNAVQVVGIQGTNWWIAPRGATEFVLASTQMPQTVRPGDRLRTGRGTRLFVRTPNLGVMQVPPLSTIEISPPPGQEGSTMVRLLQGVIYFFHRGKPADLEIQTRGASAAIRGTEFVAEAQDDGGLVIQVVDGAVELRNDQGALLLRGGEEGTARLGQPPVRTPILEVAHVIQWCLYYPAILDVDEISLSAEEHDALAPSLAAYRQGDLAGALRYYPADRTPASSAERIFLAALWLAIGQVTETETLLAPIPAVRSANESERLAAALRRLIEVTRSAATVSASHPELASEWLAESYLQQARGNLAEAREVARKATQRSPRFGFAWARLAELEFSFGRIHEAGIALRTALDLSPRHGSALTLAGFQAAARNKTSEALSWFEQAIAVDPGLGNAWLGRGLCRIQRGATEDGLLDLETAAAVEPQHAFLRSYLGKAFAESGDFTRAMKELSLAQSLDPNDPTAWFYRALVDQQLGLINDGIRDLQTSKALNGNRSVYRSQLLLDQDQAVRGANLSALYRDAGLVDVSRREAVDAVHADYANYSAHLFLANSYDNLRDPGQLELRYETPWFNEYLLANLLAPAGAGTLSPAVSAQEFSRLFERRQLGLVSLTEYGSNGDWRQSAAQYGICQGLAYSVEEDYRSSNGQRPNNDLEQLTLSVKLKQEIGPKDSVFFQSTYYDAHGGDLTRVYDPSDPGFFRPDYRFKEYQEPLLLAGYHHEWSPGQHTLALAGRLHDRLAVRDPSQPILLVAKEPSSNAVTGTLLTGVEQRYQSELEIYSLELQHIAQVRPWTFIAGARGQLGQFDTASRQQNLRDQAPALPDPLVQHVTPDLQRVTAYSYGQWQIAEPLFALGGLSYDYLQFPVNHRFAPLRADEESRSQWSPKAGLLWKITPASTLRGAYSRSLGGVSFEQSYRLEPSQIAGLNQAWRSLIPESAAGSQAGARLEGGSLEWDHRFPTDTYVGLRGDVYRSTVNREVGVFDLRFLAEPSSTPEHLKYRESTFTAVVNQLIGKSVALGASYRLSNAQLDDRFSAIPTDVPHEIPPNELKPRQDLESTLHQVQLIAAVNHPSGYFGSIEALWSLQSNHGYSPARPGDDFWQFNAYAGYRFPGRRAELRVGLLNITDQDYRLNPLNLTAELPRDRALVMSLKLAF